MSHIRPLAFLVALMFVACFTLACGSSGSMSGRQLQSITLNAVGDCCESAFTATGDYSAFPSGDSFADKLVDWDATGNVSAYDPDVYSDMPWGTAGNLPGHGHVAGEP